MIEPGIQGPIGLGGGGATPTLQQVTTAGNTTDQDIIVTQSKSFIVASTDIPTGDYVKIQPSPDLATSGSYDQFVTPSNGDVQTSGYGLWLPCFVVPGTGGGTVSAGRDRHYYQIDLSGGGTRTVQLDAILYNYPGIQFVIKITAVGGLNPTLKLIPSAGTIEGVASVQIPLRSNISIRIVNDGANWSILDIYNDNFQLTGVSPTIAATAAAGAGASAAFGSPFDNYAGVMNLTIGAGATASSTLFNITFNEVLPSDPRAVIIQRASAGTGIYTAILYAPKALATKNGFSINSSGAAPAAGTQSFFYYVIV